MTSPFDIFEPNFFSGLEIVTSSAFIWAPIILVILSWRIWIRYVNELFLLKIDWVLLEIRLPKDVHKSPEAMEIVLQALYQTGGVGNWYYKYWLGQLPLWHSLEIVSIGGNIFFFLRTPKKFKDIIETQIYSQYPQAEVAEVEDYAFRVPPFGTDPDWKLFGTEFGLSKADPIPIKTYIDFGLDKTLGLLKEEQRIDPLTATIEFMGSLKQGEQLWFQILIRPSNWARYNVPKSAKKGAETKLGKWTDLAKHEIEKIMDKYATEDDKGKKKPSMGNVPKSEQNVISAIERNMAKLGFDAGIRVLYIGYKDAFKGTNIAGMMGMLRQFNSNELNSFVPKNVTDFSSYPWEDLTGYKLKHSKRSIFNAYRLRSFFYPPYERTPFVLSTEELATIFHFPGRVSETPSFKRIDSKKVEPPVNLPM